MRQTGQYDPARDTAKADAISHAVRNVWTGESGRHVFLAHDRIEALLRGARIRSPFEQVNNLILWLGELRAGSDDPSAYVVSDTPALASIIGSRSDRPAVNYVISYAEGTRGWIESRFPGAPGLDLRLTFAGWERHEELQRATVDSRRAFMAMQFNDPAVQDAFENCFKPAAADAGFDLRLVTDGQGAGLIDDHLRVAIRAARFLVADLTTGNRGAYWEAGFAEGLGRPVIYVCRADVFNDTDHQHRPHFDTNHLNTVLWSPDRLDVARRRLADTIRNTFPAEAVLTSD